MNIGFIGLGNMGMGMATNILKRGYPLTVHDLRMEIAEPLLKAGASWADTPKKLGMINDIIFTSLPGPKEVEAVALGNDGIIDGINPDGIYIDLSTNSPVLMRKIYDKFKEKGAHVLDAPLSGGKIGAETGKLTIMVGGDENIFQRSKAVMEAIGNKVNYTGSIGTGNICKLMHNCIGIGIQVLAAESLTLGIKAGVEPDVLLQMILDGAVGQNVFFKHIVPNLYYKGQFEPPNFALRLAYKDICLATTLGQEFNVPMPLSSLAQQEMLMAVNRGWKDKDATISMLLQEERAGCVIKRNHNMQDKNETDDSITDNMKEVKLH
jgi:3-hydroxyisobutyrate dehydrogenase-like beta-hydroxyacid dehydrogenase